MAGITKRVGEFGAESIRIFPETGERPHKVQALDSGLFMEILYMFLWSVFLNVVKDGKQNGYNMTTAT